MRESKGVSKPGGGMKVSTSLAGRSPAWPAPLRRREPGESFSPVAGSRYARRAGRARPPHGGPRMHSGAQAEDLPLSGPAASSRGIPLAST